MKNNKKIYCLYFHINPVKNEVFYVGIGNYKRPYVIKCRSDFWNKTVNKYGYEIKIINTELSWKEACELEKEWIKKIGRRDLKEGPLVNLTDGGEGNNNFSDVILKKMSNTKSGQRNEKKVISLTGKKFAKLLVKEKGENIKNKIAWICDCDCGNKNILVKGEYLKSYRTKSCGCISRDTMTNKCNIPIYQIDKKNNKTLVAFSSMTIASIKTNVSISSIQHFLKGNSKHGGGYDWKKITVKEFNDFEGAKNIGYFKKEESIFDKNIKKL